MLCYSVLLVDGFVVEEGIVDPDAVAEGAIGGRLSVAFYALPVALVTLTTGVVVMIFGTGGLAQAIVDKVLTPARISSDSIAVARLTFTVTSTTPALCSAQNPKQSKCITVIVIFCLIFFTRGRYDPSGGFIVIIIIIIF